MVLQSNCIERMAYLSTVIALHIHTLLADLLHISLGQVSKSKSSAMHPPQQFQQAEL
jgi:hypothetical protein